MPDVPPRQPEDTTATTTTAAVTPTPPKKKSLPKGLILGPDGKPCRSCNSFRDFYSATTATAATAAPRPNAPPPDCPPDVEQLGRASWTLLHTIAATYPRTPTATQQHDMRSFMTIFANIYPCWSCAADFRDWMARPENDVGGAVCGRDALGLWLCRAHNDVNVRLGKPPFDCARWQERWRPGGKGC